MTFETLGRHVLDGPYEKQGFGTRYSACFYVSGSNSIASRIKLTGIEPYARKRS